MENDRIFVNTSSMKDSVVVMWAAAAEGITSRGDRPDFDGEIMIFMDGTATIKWWDCEDPFVLVLDPQRRNGAYVTVYEAEDQPPAEDARIAWSPVFPDGRPGYPNRRA